MVKIGLQISANLEFVTELIPEEVGEFKWTFKFKCNQCGEVPDHWMYVALNEEQPLKGGRGHANFIAKCKNCLKQNSCDIKEESIASYNFEDARKFKTIVVLDCRGLEPVDFDPRSSWKAKGYTEDEDGDGKTTGTEFDDIDLTDKEWSDYDEKSGESTMISEFKCNFVVVKD